MMMQRENRNSVNSEQHNNAKGGLLSRVAGLVRRALGTGEDVRVCDALEPRAMLAADLTTNISSPTGGTLARGAQYGGVVSISNSGTTVSSDARVTVQVYLSATSTFNATTAQPLSGATAVFTGIMFSGQIKEDNFVFTVPTSTADGNYYLFARVDPGNTIGESNEGNNISPGVGIIVNNSGGGGEVIETPEIDLRASVALLTPTLIVNSPITVRVNVSNIAPDELILPGTFVQLYMTRNTAANPSVDTAVGDVQLNIALRSNEVQSREVTFTLPENVSSGVYRFYAVVDGSNQTVETNEGNNTSNLVQGQFNLTVRDITGSIVSTTLPTEIVEGTRPSRAPTIKYNIRNASDFAMASNTSIGLRGYLRPVFAADSSLDILASDQRNESLSKLAPQTSRERSLTAKIPTTLAAGSYRYVIILDNTGKLAEINENNNTIDSGIIITILPKSYDPVISGVATQLPENMRAGRKSNVTLSLGNLGNTQYKGNATFIFSIFDANGVEVGSQSITKKLDIRPGRTVKVSGLGVTAPTTAGVYTMSVRVELPITVVDQDLFNNAIDLRPITVV